MNLLNRSGDSPEPHRRAVFFSSRRRHTRLVSDWSSDVCSSDLQYLGAQAMEEQLKRLRSPRVLHLATHGYFWDVQEAPAVSGSLSEVSGGMELGSQIGRAHV